MVGVFLAVGFAVVSGVIYASRALQNPEGIIILLMFRDTYSTLHNRHDGINILDSSFRSVHNS